MMMFTAVDLFSGAGGLSYGLTQEGFQVRVAVEVDPVTAQSYSLNHAATAVLVQDVRQVKGPQILKKAGLERGTLDLLTGCPPCQAFSTLRTKRRSQSVEDPSRYLILEILRLIRSTRPRAVILENVPGLAKDINFDIFCSGLSRSGYQFQYSALNASDFGVPQRRRRLILVALRGQAVPSDWASHDASQSTVRSAIGKLPKAGSSGDILHDIPERRTPQMFRRIQATPQDGGSRKNVPKEMQCACHSRSSGFHDVYGRMAWDDVSSTITSGCTNPSKGRFLHPEEHRAITLREAALLQSFPKDYQFCLKRGKDHVATQIGNAFPPQMIRPIVRVLRRELSSRSTEQEY